MSQSIKGVQVDDVTIEFNTSRQLTAKGGQRVEVFDASGTWTCPANVGFIKVTLVGGGGGGGGSSGAGGGGGGGGGGATIINHVLRVTPSSTYAVTVGAGGDGGASGVAGSDGADSSFVGDDHTITAEKGSGGGANGGAGGAGGAAVTDLDGGAQPAGADTAYRFAGGAGKVQSSDNGGGGGGSMLCGLGGAGGASGAANPGVAAPDGTGGGGGGGAGSSGGGIGAAGGNGLVIIEYNTNGTPS